MKPGIHIPEPCHESWQAMQPQQNGRFCDSCCKVVVDFTAMSNEQITAYLQSKKEEKVCGRFKKTQVTEPVKEVKTIRVKWQLQKFAAALWLAFGALLFTACNTSAPKQKTIESYPKAQKHINGLIILPETNNLTTAIAENPKNKPATICITGGEENYTTGAPVQEIIIEDQLMGEPAVVEIIKGEVLAPDTISKPDTLPQALPVIIEHEMGKVQYVEPEKNKRKKRK
jgi:hypothetical protein